MRRTLLVAAATAALSVGAGCGTTILATVGAILATGGGGGGGGGGRDNEAPAVSIAAITSPQAGDVAIFYAAIDAESNPVSISVRVSLDGGVTFLPGEAAEALPASQGRTNLSSSPSGEQHLFVWNSFFDTGPVNADDVVIELRPRDAATGAEGEPRRTAPFALRNAYMATIAGGFVEPDPGLRTLPVDVALAKDAGGALVAIYFSDAGLHRVWRVDAATGEVEAVAGSGAQGFDGDNVPATQAALNAPRGIALEPDEDDPSRHHVYIADTANHRIRRVDARTGFITTVAGNGLALFAGDGALATSASFNLPQWVALDALGNLVISDTGNDRIRVVNRQSVSIRIGSSVTIAPNEVGTVLSLRDIAQVDLQRRLRGSLEAAGPAAVATRGVPARGPSFSPSSTLEIYFADPTSGRVWRMGTSGSVSVVAGSVSTGNVAALRSPQGIALVDVPSGTAPVFVADAERQRLTFHAGSTFAIAAGKTDAPGFEGDGGLATEALLRVPLGVAGTGSADGLLVFADAFNQRVRAVNLGVADVAIAGKVLGPGEIDTIARIGSESPTPLAQAFAVVADGPEGSFFYADAVAGTVFRVDGATRVETPIAEGLRGPSGLALDRAGGRNLLYVAETSAHRVVRIDLGAAPPVEPEPFAGTGVQTASIDGSGGADPSDDLGDGGPAALATLSSPVGIAVDPATGDVYIADTGNHRVRVVATGGGGAPTIATFVNDALDAGGKPIGGFNGNDGPRLSTRLASPTGVAIDPRDPDEVRLLIADFGNDRLRSVTLAGDDTLVTIANRNTTGTAPETPVGGYSGDNIAATDALLDDPFGVTVLGGDLVFTDTRNQRIRAIRADGIIVTLAGVGSAGFNGDAIPPENAAVFTPTGVAAEPETATVIFCDTENLRVRRFAAEP